MEKSELNNRLIDHYQCFNTERFWLDKYNEREGFVSVVSGITDNCPIPLCRGIAKFIKKQIPKEILYKFNFIYVGAWAIKTESL